MPPFQPAKTFRHTASEVFWCMVGLQRLALATIVTIGGEGQSDWEQIHGSAKTILRSFKAWRSTIPSHLAWGADSAHTIYIPKEALRGYYYEILSSMLRPYLRNILSHCSKYPEQAKLHDCRELLRISLDAIASSLPLRNHKDQTQLSPVASALK